MAYTPHEMVDTRPLYEQSEEMIIDLFGEYEVQTVEVTQTTTDGALIINTVVPDGIGSLDYMWLLNVAIFYFIAKGIKEMVVALWNRMFGTKRRKKF